MSVATETFDNVNFQILLKMHGGNFHRAKAAWDKICQLGGYGAVPHTYDGGLDVKGLRIHRDEIDHGGNDSFIRSCGPNPDRPGQNVTTDDLKRIEDIASGDRPAIN